MENEFVNPGNLTIYKRIENYLARISLYPVNERITKSFCYFDQPENGSQWYVLV
jgi:hypothetical protein